MKPLLVLLAIVTLGSIATAQDARIESAIRQKMDEMEKERKSQSEVIEAMAKGKISPRLPKPADFKPTKNGPVFFFRTKEDRENAIATAKAKLESGHSLVPTLKIQNAMKVGDFGRLDSMAEYEIAQIIDEGNMRLNVRNLTFRQARVDYGDSYNVWVKGNTKGLTDGTKIQIEDVFQVTGTKQYNTAIGGSKTVYVLEKVNVGPIIERLRKEREAEKQEPREPKPTKPAEREWSDMSGLFKLTATFLSSDGESVSLRKSDGQTISVPVKRLSQADQDYVSEQSND